MRAGIFSARAVPARGAAFAVRAAPMLLLAALAGCTAAAAAADPAAVSAPSPRLRAATLAAQCPRGAYDGEDARAAACWAFINGVVDVVLVREVETISAECRAQLAVAPLTSVDRIRAELLDRDNGEALAAEAIIEIIVARICRS